MRPPERLDCSEVMSLEVKESHESFNISVKAKLFATLALAGVVMIAVGVLGLSGTKSSNARSRCDLLQSLHADRLGRRDRGARARGAGEGGRRRHPSGRGGREGRGRPAHGARGEVQGAAGASCRRPSSPTRSARSSRVRGATATTCSASCRKRCWPRRRARSTSAESALIEKARPTYEKLTASGDALLRSADQGRAGDAHRRREGVQAQQRDHHRRHRDRHRPRRHCSASC